MAQSMIINELSNGASGSKEFVEFLVTGNCGQTLDIRNWYFDDNCVSPGAANGNGRFANIAQWSAVPVGTLIVIYNEADLNAALPASDPTDSNCDGVYVIPCSSNVIQFQPTVLASCAASAYTATTGYVTGTSASWGTVMSLANAGDAFQIRDASGNIAFSVSYGTATGGTVSTAISGTGSCFRFTGAVGSDPTNVANWTANTNASTLDSPGKGNNCNNAAFIEALRTVKDNEFKVSGCSNVTSTNTSLCVGATASKNLTGCTSDSYVWSTSDASVATVSGTGQSATITAVGAGTANIVVTVTQTYSNLYTGLTGCSATPIVKTMTYPVTVNAKPTLSLAPSCAGGAGTGILTPTFTAGAGGSPTYNPATLTGLADNTYTVTVTESGSGCTATASGTISCAVTCAADATGFTATVAPTSFCQIGGILSGSSTTFSTASFDYDVIYLLVDNATGIVVSSDFDVASLVAPDNNGTTIKTYSVYALVYELAQDVVIINGTSTIIVGDVDVIKDIDGDGLAASPTATACMDLSASAATVVVNPKPTLSDDIDDLNCSGTGAAIDVTSNASGTTITWTAALTSGTATGFSNNTTPTAVSNTTGTYEINSTLTNTGTTNAVVTYTITPAVNGCMGNNYVVALTIFPPLTFTTTETCSGTDQYDVSFTLAGGSGSGYNVSNSTGTLSYTAGATSGSVTAINVGTSLTLDVQDDEFCTGTATASITLPTLSLASSCAGGAGTGVITPTFTAGEGGTPSYIPATLTSLGNNIYTVTVTESGSGCTATSVATINCVTATTASVNADLTDPCYCITAPTLDADNNVTANGTFGDEMIITTSPVNTNLVWQVSTSTATSPAVGATFTNNNDGTYTINIVYPAGAGGSAGSWSITATETSGSGLAAQTMSGGSACAYTIGTLSDVIAPACSAAAITLSATPTGGTWGGAATVAGTYTPVPATTAQGPFPYSYTYDAFPVVGAHAACPLTLNADISVPACNASSCTPAGGTW